MRDTEISKIHSLTLTDRTSNKEAKNENLVIKDYTKFSRWITGGGRGDCQEEIQVKQIKKGKLDRARQRSDKSILAQDNSIIERRIKSLVVFRKLPIVWHGWGKKI